MGEENESPTLHIFWAALGCLEIRFLYGIPWGDPVVTQSKQLRVHINAMHGAVPYFPVENKW